MFLDKVTITIKAGDGGKGAVSFYRSALTAKGGPDGGDGGKGGDVVFKVDSGMNTLYSFSFKKKFVAENGTDGGKTNKTGKDGKDVVILVPAGTVIYDAESGKVIADLRDENQTFIALKGGKGGKGNAFFATPTRQAPHFSQEGEKCKFRKVVLELKTIADVGLIGYPNVGKSTLLSVISNAKPKIADYAFTTLFPNLGVVDYYGNTFVVADIPGLIEGASEGVGLGHEFLKHAERVRLILHLIDISESEGRSAFKDFITINEELKKYSQKLYAVPQIIVLSKCDLLSEESLAEKVKAFENECKKNNINYPIIKISSVTNSGLDELKKQVYEKLKTLPKSEPIDIEEYEFDKRDKTSLIISRNDDGSFNVTGGLIDNMIRGVVLSDEVSFAYFQKRLKEDGIIDKLKERGLKEGDTVHIKDITFEYLD